LPSSFSSPSLSSSSMLSSALTLPLSLTPRTRS
jgi:hypothetical protein